MSRRSPRKIGGLIRELATEAEPATPLARAQGAWERAAGSEFGARCRPISERDGVITVLCESAVWAQELDLRQAEIVSRLRDLGAETARSLRCRSGPAG